jgi:hypothetical protein
MRITKLLLVSMCCLIAAPTAWSQQANNPAKAGRLGYLDPHTGVFRPILAAAEEDAELPAATPFTGTITVTLTITLKTTGLTNITCIADVAALDANTVALEESNTVAATGTGSTRTCKLTIPYAWSLATQSTDHMQTSYTVLGAAATGLPQRTSSRNPLDTRNIPGNGVTTALTAAVTL